MFFKKNELKREKERNNECLALIRDLRDKIFEVNKEILDVKAENKKIKEEFTKNYHYVLTVDKTSRYIHLYQDGQEIERIQSIDFKASMDSFPTFNIEVN